MLYIKPKNIKKIKKIYKCDKKKIRREREKGEKRGKKILMRREIKKKFNKVKIKTKYRTRKYISNTFPR